MVKADDADFVLTLTSGRRPIAVLREIDRDQPWVMCEFHALPGFDAVRPVLERARRELAEGESTFRSMLRYRLLRLRLRSTNGYPTIRRLWLVVDGDRASYRFSLGPVGGWKLRRWARRQVHDGGD